MIGASAALGALGVILISDSAIGALVCWLALAVLQGCFAVTAWRVARTTRSRAVRRLWSTCVVGGGAYVIGNLLQVWALLRGSRDVSAILGSDAHALAVSIGTAAMLVGMLSSPSAITSASTRARYRLDVLTVMAAATTIGLYAVELPGTQRGGATMGQGLVAMATGPAVMLVAVLAMIKLLMGGNPPFTRTAGLVCGVAAGVQGALLTLPHSWAQDRVGWVLCLSVVGTALLAAGAREQLRETGTEDAAPREDAPLRYSALPYAAIGATYALLFIDLAANGLNPHAWVLLIGTVVCSALVWRRQMASFREIADLSARLRDLAFQDTLTGLANRAKFLDRLAQAAEPTVFLIDLDEFKPVNDRYGHGAGDHLLREVARRIQACVRAEDTVARLGGDEFAVLADELSPQRRAEVATALRQALHDDVRLGEAVLPLRASVGVATGGTDVLHRADMAMYEEKQRRQRQPAGSIR